jgi:hypothetical protein
MKTGELIELISKDAGPVHRSQLSTVALGLAVGSLVSILIYLIAVGWRPDFGVAIETLRFPLKFAITIPLAVGGVGCILRLSRPAVPLGPWPWLMLAAAALLLASVAGELAVVPSAEWLRRLVGSNWYFCLSLIPLLSAAPLAGLLYALRSGAPENGDMAGAVAGLAAGGIAATLYASHCTDDSPLFVVTWYSLAIAMVTLAGMLIGRRLLRW